MKLNNLVSIEKNIIEDKHPNKDGRMARLRPITKNNFAKDSYNECAN